MSDASKLLGKCWLYSGDVSWSDYGGKWIRHVGARTYHVIQFLNWADTVGEDEARGGSKYNCDLAIVDLDAIDEHTLKGARSFVGMEDDEANDLWLAEACHSYGAKAPVWSDDGNNAHALVRAARAESANLLRDAGALSEAMDRPVNALGSTAAEYMRGDIQSAVLRGVAVGDPRAELMLKLGVGSRS